MLLFFCFPPPPPTAHLRGGAMAFPTSAGPSSCCPGGLGGVPGMVLERCFLFTSMKGAARFVFTNSYHYPH